MHAAPILNPNEVEVPLRSGPPTREELLRYYPAKFSWTQLKTFVNSGLVRPYWTPVDIWPQKTRTETLVYLNEIESCRKDTTNGQKELNLNMVLSVRIVLAS